MYVLAFEPTPTPTDEPTLDESDSDDVSESDAQDHSISVEQAEAELFAAEPEERLDQPDEPELEKPQRKVQSKLIDRFASATSLVWDEDRGFYVHANGSRLYQVSGPYPWQLYTATGQLIRSYWLSEQCLTTTAGIELNAEIWNLLDKSPETHAFVLVDEFGQPKQWLGPELLSMVQGESMSLYLAKYRLRVE